MFKTIVVCDHCGTEKVTVTDTSYGRELGFYGSYYGDGDTAYKDGWRIRKYWKEGENRTKKLVHRVYEGTRSEWVPSSGWKGSGHYEQRPYHEEYDIDIQDAGNILHLCPDCVKLADAPEPKRVRNLSQKQLLAELVAISPLTTKNAGLYDPLQCRYCGTTQGHLSSGYENAAITIDLEKTKHAETCIWKLAKDKVSNA